MNHFHSHTLVTDANRKEWLVQRAAGLGASDCAAVLGVHPYKTPLRLYLEKTGQGPEDDAGEAAEIGLLMEPVLATLYTRRTGFKLHQQQVFVRHPTIPYLAATLDAIREDGALVEFKNMSEWVSKKSLGDDETDELPDHFIAQAQVQMACYGADLVDFAVLVGGNRFRRFTVERSDTLIGQIIEKAGDFWDRVLTRIPPDVSRASDAGLMHLLHPDEGPSMAGDALLHSLVEAYSHYGETAKEAKEKKKLAKAHILESLGEAGSAKFSDGSEVSRKVIRRAETTIVQSAREYAQIYISKPKKGR